MGSRVVVATHEVTRTGAPLSLLHVLRWLCAHSTLKIQVLVAELGGDGDHLLGDFEATVPTRIVPELFDRGAGGPPLPDCDLLYVNSVFAAGVLAHLPRRRPYVITRVPELAVAFGQLTDAERSAVLDGTDHFLAVSDAVRRMLTEDYSVEVDRISVIHGSIDLSGHHPSSMDARRARRSALGLPPDAFVVGAAGTTDWRKGPDLFLRMATLVADRSDGRPVHFLWLGGRRGGPSFWRVACARAPTGLAERVHFVGSRPDPFAYYELMDVFALTSREDPFPRVCMEVAAVGVPIVTFDNGGAVELVAKGCGVVVPYSDPAAMAAAVSDLLDDEERGASLGATGASVVRAEHTVEVGGPATLAEIERGLRAAAR